MQVTAGFFSPAYSNVKKIYVEDSSMHLLSEVPDDPAYAMH